MVSRKTLVAMISCLALAVGVSGCVTESPLLTAINNNNLQETRRLLEAGEKPDKFGSVNPSAPDKKDGYALITPISLAAARGNLEISLLLLDRGVAPMTVIAAAANFGKPDILRAIFEKHDLDLVELEKDKPYETKAQIAQIPVGTTRLAYNFYNSQGVLIKAVKSRNPDAVRILLEHKANPNGLLERKVNSNGIVYYDHRAPAWDVPAPSFVHLAPLIMAAYNGDVEIASLLIDHGADVNLRPGDGKRVGPGPLHFAVLTIEDASYPYIGEVFRIDPNKKCTNMVKLLLANGANPLQEVTDPIPFVLETNDLTKVDLMKITNTGTPYDYVTAFKSQSFPLAGTPYEEAVAAMKAVIDRNTATK